MNTIIEKIRAEVERLMDEYKPTIGGIDEITGAHIALAKLHTFLSDLEKSEKPTTAEGLEEESERMYLKDTLTLRTRAQYADLARHFAQWGAEHYLKLESLAKFAEMTGSIDTMPKNTLPPSKECEKGLREPLVSDDLEEAAEEYAYNNWEDNDYHTGASEGLPFDAIGHTEKCFKAGAKWQKEQMMKEAVEGEVMKSNKYTFIRYQSVNEIEGKSIYPGDKVHVIVIKEDKK